MQRVLLVILDGFGLLKKEKNNAIALAKTPHIDEFFKHPWIKIDSSGPAVGLPKGQMGTSEVGHLTIGAGRIVDQDLVRINKAIRNGAFQKNKVLKEAMRIPKNNSLHLIGLCSEGGVHSHLRHLIALLKMAKQVPNVYVHMVTDGRDTPPREAASVVEKLERACKQYGARIASVTGRYYTMDRDKRWQRTELAHKAIVQRDAPVYKSATAAIRAAYAQGQSDEFIQPRIIGTEGGISNGDSVIFFNFRADRARQLCRALTDRSFKGFQRKQKQIYLTTFTQYDKGFPFPVAFPSEDIRHCLAQVISSHKYAQFHTAETEKYAHVTYFLNGGREKVFPKEKHVLVPSPKVATYDKKPIMNARGVTTNICAALDKYEFIVANYANADMVGHTGNLQATIAAVETLDKNLGEIWAKAKKKGYVMLVTADHGNAEEMTGTYQTSHTLNKVPFIVLDPVNKLQVDRRNQGTLADIAPTVLKIMNIPIPKKMTGTPITS